MIVYKYYPPTDYTFDALCNRYFFFSKVGKLNDPYDSSFNLIKGSRLANNLIANGRISPDMELLMREYATCSFSAINNSMHMWAFYANNFSGVAVGYDDSKFKEITERLQARVFYYKVSYLNKMFNVDRPFVRKLHNLTQGAKWICSNQLFKGDQKLDDDFFAYLYTLKHKDTWAGEKEYRLIVGNDIVQRKERLDIEYTVAGYKIPMPKGVIKEIIIGHNFPESRYYCIKHIAEANGILQINQTSAEEPFNIKIIPANI